MIRLGVLVSGLGTNLQAILDSITSGNLRASVAVVVSNHAGVRALDRAAELGIPFRVRERDDFETRRAQHGAIATDLAEFQVDLVVCAGFDRILHSDVVRRFEHRIINIHPSLLPAFGGGLHAVSDALAHGVKLTGCTVHIVTDQLDAGPIIAQAAVPVLENDDVQSLAARVKAAEHTLLPQVIALFSEGRVTVDGQRVHILDPISSRLN